MSDFSCDINPWSIADPQARAEMMLGVARASEQRVTEFLLKRAEQMLAWSRGELDLEMEIVVEDDDGTHIETLIVRAEIESADGFQYPRVEDNPIWKTLVGNPAQELADALAGWFGFPSSDSISRKMLEAIREKVYERDGHTCRYCGASEGLSLDHIFPRSRGGSDSMENLVTACRSCNSRKGARTPDEARMILRGNGIYGQ